MAKAAAAEGLSLTRYMQRELAHLARRAEVVQHNAAVIRRTQRRVQGRAGRDTVLAVLHEGRAD